MAKKNMAKKNMAKKNTAKKNTAKKQTSAKGKKSKQKGTVHRAKKIKSKKKNKPRSVAAKKTYKKKAVKKQTAKKTKARKSVSRPLRSKKAEPMAKLLLPLGRIKEIFRTRYGFFLFDGSEFVVNTPETPSPWFNILSNGDYGTMISQSGCGTSFQAGIGNRITRWSQDNTSENFGKFIYIRDNKTQDFWSATWKPVCKSPEFYEVRHGIGYTNISLKYNGIISSLIYYVSADEPVEVCQIRIKNTTDQDRFLSIFSYLEWDFNKPSGNREYDKLFVDTSYDHKLGAIFAKTPDQEYAFHSVNNKIQTFTCGRDFFLGSYRDVSNPRCVEKGMCFEEQGRYNDPAAALQMEIELPPHGEKELIFTTGKCPEKIDAVKIIKKYKKIDCVEEEFSRTGHRWTVRFSGFHITTPDEGANILTNKWFRYQAISSGLSAFGSAYEPDGKVIFKDYIINGLTLLSVNPKYFRKIILDCAEKQFEDGAVIREWDPKTLKGTRSESVELPLWLVYAVCEYIKETGDLALLEEDVKFQDISKKNLFWHCKNAIERPLQIAGKKAVLPIYPGDHMDKIDETSDNNMPESVWLTQFFIYTLEAFIKICHLKKEKQLAADYEFRLKRISEKIKKIAFDKDRFQGAMTVSGQGLGGAKGKNTQIFLDTQVWAVLSGLSCGDDAISLMNNAGLMLYKEHGPVMLDPCFDDIKQGVGTISRLPEGVMENGGISMESACWAIWAETKLRRGHNAWNIYTKLNPVDRSHKSDVYKLEPFVSCGYVDGPKALTHGRARNSWYNRGCYWMFKIMAEDILGIKPTYDGLMISPCIPSRWRLFKVKRTFRNAYYSIEVLNPRYVSSGISEVIVDGKKQKSNLIPDFGDEKRHHVRVIMGKPNISA
jgi:cellobiose phosphorylase